VFVIRPALARLPHALPAPHPPYVARCPTHTPPADHTHPPDPTPYMRYTGSPHPHPARFYGCAQLRSAVGCGSTFAARLDGWLLVGLLLLRLHRHTSPAAFLLHALCRGSTCCMHALHCACGSVRHCCIPCHYTAPLRNAFPFCAAPPLKWMVMVRCLLLLSFNVRAATFRAITQRAPLPPRQPTLAPRRCTVLGAAPYRAALPRWFPVLLLPSRLLSVTAAPPPLTSGTQWVSGRLRE